VKSKQLFFAPHSVDNNRFASQRKDATIKAENWRLNLGIKKDDFVFLFAAKLTKKKDPELLIKAFLSLNLPYTKLIIIGNGELEVELKQRYQAHAAVFFIPFQNQSSMPSVYRLANVFILPSKGPGETWGLAVNEAMASGLGVIVSDKCGCATDLVNQGKNGYIFNSGNMESLKKCMRLSLSSYKKLGDYSLQVIQHYTYADTYKQLKSMIKKRLF